ncbi:MAG: 4-hydroxy-tetrahydrodipicolinate reductase, partial [Nitrococcus sp.]|nr:4-hydroxy-tetrahydrodipicolinate reductase [Nitrococcus sp.]
MVKIGISGSAGRMGRTLIAAAAQNPHTEITAAIERQGSRWIGADAGDLAGIGSLGVRLVGDLGAAVTRCDVLIDFSSPAATMANVAICREAGKPIVIGTTGLDDAQRRELTRAAQVLPIVLAPNFSAGVNLAFKLIELAAQVLGDEFDIEVIEAHHRHKVDAPSGTALRMGEILAAALGRDFGACAVRSREGHTGERASKSIGFATVRGGDIVGEHTVLYAGLGERLEITHRAS